ncbi:hypothetical protein CLF_112456 [Clonorchis sinensis]|uniref:Uncharacterized protein n=1 Tax=Clonorchis sinensis TaxID=79923 RepID=G7YWE7_CLOSI|nr:hypothetical protein CLF_112456 [Clonorchis sinensis]
MDLATTASRFNVSPEHAEEGRLHKHGQSLNRSRAKCILHTKLVNWDQRTRIIEHRIQELYGRKRTRSLSQPRPNGAHPKDSSLPKLIHHLSKVCTGEQCFSQNVSLGSNKQPKLTSVVHLLVPVTHTVNRSLTTRHTYFKPSEKTRDVSWGPETRQPKRTKPLIRNWYSHYLKWEAGILQDWILGLPFEIDEREPGISIEDRFWTADTARSPSRNKNSRIHRFTIKHIDRLRSSKAFSRKSAWELQTEQGRHLSHGFGTRQLDKERAKRTRSTIRINMNRRQIPREHLYESYDEPKPKELSKLMNIHAPHQRVLSSSSKQQLNAKLRRPLAVYTSAFQYNGRNLLECKSNYKPNQTVKPMFYMRFPLTQGRKWKIREFLAATVPGPRFHCAIAPVWRQDSGYRKKDSWDQKAGSPAQTNVSRFFILSKIQKSNLNRICSIRPTATTASKQITAGKPTTFSFDSPRDESKVECLISKKHDKNLGPHICEHHGKAKTFGQSASRVVKKSSQQAPSGLKQKTTDQKSRAPSHTYSYSVNPSRRVSKVLVQSNARLSPLTPPHTPMWVVRSQRYDPDEDSVSTDYACYINPYLPHPTPESNPDSNTLPIDKPLGNKQALLVEVALPAPVYIQQYVKGHNDSVTSTETVD